MRSSRTRIVVLSLGVLTSLNPADSGSQVIESKRITGTVTYVTPSVVYFNAGSHAGLQTGDTLTVVRGSSALAHIVISAISSTSSAAQLLPGAAAIAVGDSIITIKRVESRPAEVPVGAATGSPTSAAQKVGTGSKDNLVNGRIALQYAGAGALGTLMDFSQPSLLLRLGIDRLFGTGLRFTMYGRSSYDLGDQYTRFTGASRTSTRIYEMNVAYDDSRSPFGYSVGRIISPFLGGLGQFDGGQVFVRIDRFSAGLAAGAQADPRNSAVDFNYQKAALFVNYAWSDDAFHSADASVAYGQQLFHGRFDRDFLYTQVSLRPATSVTFYGSSEFDLHDVSNGTRISRFHLTSTFVTLSFTPVRWMTVNSGYDATRSIYLFETMKIFQDTLLNRELQQGIRGGLIFRLPVGVLLMTNGTLRPGVGGARRAYTVNTVLRMSDIDASGINAGIQYTKTVGIYTSGNDIALDCDRWLSQSVFIGTRLDYYTYTINYSSDHLAATTLTLNTNVLLSRTWYFLLNFDQIWDSLRKTQRIYSEIGLRF